MKEHLIRFANFLLTDIEYTFPPALVGICVPFGTLMIVYHPSVLRGFVGSFVLVTGIQVALWFCGIRTELLGTAPEPLFEEPTYHASMSQIMKKVPVSQRILWDHEQEITELKSKIADAVMLNLEPARVDELKSKLQDAIQRLKREMEIQGSEQSR